MNTRGGPGALGEAQDRVIDTVLVTVPYNSAAPFHHYFGTRAAPERFGSSCAWQTFAAGRMVSERTAVDADYLVDGRHVAAVYRGSGHLTVLDPYLLHEEPLRLDRAEAVDGVVRASVSAYPHRVGRGGAPAPAKVRAGWDLADDSLRLDYVRYSPRRDHNVLSRSFVLSPRARLPAVPPPDGWVRPQLLHPEQHSVSVRVLHPRSRRMAEVVLPLADRPTGSRRDLALMIAKNNQGRVSRHGTPGFEAGLDTVADALAASGDEVTEFLLEAAALHRSAAPAGLELARYDVEDE